MWTFSREPVRLFDSQPSARSRATRVAARQGAKYGAFLAVCAIGVGAMRILSAGGRAPALPSLGALFAGAVGYVVALACAGAVLNAVRVRYLSEFARGLAWAVMGILGMLLMGVVLDVDDRILLPVSFGGGVFLGLVFGYGVGAIQLTDAERARSNDGW